MRGDDFNVYADVDRESLHDWLDERDAVPREVPGPFGTWVPVPSWREAAQDEGERPRPRGIV